MIRSFISFMILLLLIDSIWVVGAGKLHSNIVKTVQQTDLKVDITAAILFYILASIGYVLIIKKLAKTPTDALLYGMLLGLLMYGTFDLTNKAIFTKYPWYYTIADMTWGTVCLGVVSFITFSAIDKSI